MEVRVTISYGVSFSNAEQVLVFIMLFRWQDNSKLVFSIDRICILQIFRLPRNSSDEMDFGFDLLFFYILMSLAHFFSDCGVAVCKPHFFYIGEMVWGVDHYQNCYFSLNVGGFANYDFARDFVNWG